MLKPFKVNNHEFLQVSYKHNKISLVRYHKICKNRFLIRVRSESCSIYVQYTGKNDPKLDSLSFLTLITKLQQRSPF